MGNAIVSIVLCITLTGSLICLPSFAVPETGAQSAPKSSGASLFAGDKDELSPVGDCGVLVERDGSTNFVFVRDLTDTSAGYLKTCFKNRDAQIKILRNGVELTDTDLVGTGCTVKCVSSIDSSDVYETATAVVLGDVDGDGDVDENDYNAILDKAVMGIDGLITDGSAYYKAADCREDGAIDGFDLSIADLVISHSKSYIGFEKVNYNEFETVFEHTDEFLYRVGNGNTVKLGSLFGVEATGDAAVASADVNIGVYSVDGDTSVCGTVSNSYLLSDSTAKCVYSKDSSDWTKSTLKFTGEGPVVLTIADGEGRVCYLNLEIVNANNATTATSASSTNIVLLNDVSTNSLSVNNKKTLYGNGFTIDCSNSNVTTQHNIVSLSNGTLNNVKIIGPKYNNAAVYWSDSNYIHTVSASGSSYIYNCYIAYSRAPLQILDTAGGTTTVENSVFDGGRYCNIFVKSGNISLHNVTTINQPRLTDNGNLRVGYGIVIGEEASGTTIQATGYLKQYNWLGKNTDKDYCVGDNSANNSNTTMATLFSNMYSKASEYTASYNGDTYINTGILCLKDTVQRATGNALSEYAYKTISVGGYSGWVMTENGQTSFNASESLKYYSSTSYESSQQIPTVPDFNWNYPSSYKDGAINISFDTSSSVDFDPYFLSVTKYGIPLDVSVSMNGVNYTGNNISFSSAGVYTVYYTITDPYNYSNELVSSERTYSKTLTVNVTEKKPSIKEPEFTFFDYNGNSLGSKVIEINGNKYVMPDVNGTSDTVKSTEINGVYCPVVESRFKDNSSDFNYLLPVFTGVTIKNYTDINGNSVTYSKSSNLNDLPSNLQWLTNITWNGKGWIGYARDNSYGLYKKSEAMGSNQGEHSATVKFKFEAGNGEVYYYYINYHAAAHNKPSCVAEGTLVTMADGTKKPIEQVNQGDMVMTWSLWNGCYEAQPVAIKWHHDGNIWQVLTLNFSDGTDVRMINDHGFFDVDENKFVYITPENVDNYIGHKFIKQTADGNTTVVLTDYSIAEENVGCYSILTANNYSFIVDDMLSMTGEENYKGRFDFFTVGEGMKYDEELMQADIARYGLYTLDNFDGYLTTEQFEGLKVAYYKVLVGKGVFSYDDILGIIKDNL